MKIEEYKLNPERFPGPILRTEEIHKTYYIGKRPVEVLHGVSLEIRRGEAVSIMGASGAGKSTLLHILGGLDQPDSGDVFFENRSLCKMSPARRAAFRAARCGFVFQSYHLLPELDVLQNVMLPAMAVKRKSGVQERAQYLLEQVGLSARTDHRPAELSGGEQQRVAIARALINTPDLLLADEPTGNLDSHTGENILNILFTLAQTDGLTLIVVTHNEEVARRCRHELILKDGKLEK
ncbi:MAG: ABC transporter ATP-binding protein [Kiritimatiellales bacterium]